MDLSTIYHYKKMDIADAVLRDIAKYSNQPSILNIKKLSVPPEPNWGVGWEKNGEAIDPANYAKTLVVYLRIWIRPSESIVSYLSTYK